MICEPCRHPHQPEACVDHAAEREGPMRACCCQHQPYEHQEPAAEPASDAEDTAKDTNEDQEDEE